jgi:hypothetical protein
MYLTQRNVLSAAYVVTGLSASVRLLGETASYP